MSYADDQMDMDIYSASDPEVKDCISCEHVVSVDYVDYHKCKTCVDYSHWE